MRNTQLKKNFQSLNYWKQFKLGCEMCEIIINPKYHFSTKLIITKRAKKNLHAKLMFKFVDWICCKWMLLNVLNKILIFNVGRCPYTIRDVGWKIGIWTSLRIQLESSCVSKIFFKLIRFGQNSNICVRLGFLVVSRRLARH